MAVKISECISCKKDEDGNIVELAESVFCQR